MVDAFSYHCSKHIVNPTKKLDKNIKGLELEINDYDAGEYLEDLIDDRIIVCPYNEDEIPEEERNIAIEYDGSVDWELIFKADTINPLMKRIKELNEYGLNPSNVNNGSGTSAHIHLNRRFLDNLGVTRMDMTKAVEFNGQLMYLFSGRNRDSLEEWCRSRLHCNIDEDLLTKANAIDRIREVSYNRYNMLNLSGDKTDELRIFSNRCSFDYKTLRFYLEYTDMLIDLAQLMHGKSYVDNFDECVTFIDDYMLSKPRRKVFYDKYNINSILLQKEDLEHVRVIRMWESIDDRIKRFEGLLENHSRDENTLSLLRLVRDVNRMSNQHIDFSFNPMTVVHQDAAQEIREDFIRRYNL